MNSIDKAPRLLVISATATVVLTAGVFWGLRKTEERSSVTDNLNPTATRPISSESAKEERRSIRSSGNDGRRQAENSPSELHGGSEKMVGSLKRRLGDLREELRLSADPASLLNDILEDIQSLDEFTGKFYFSRLASELGKIDADTHSRLDFLAHIYPQVSSVLGSAAGPFGTLESRVYSAISGNLLIAQADAEVELAKIADQEVRNNLASGILPELMLLQNSTYDEVLDSYPVEVQRDIFQRVIERAGDPDLEGRNRLLAVELYLNSMGHPGLQPGVVGDWFSDRSWLWREPQAVADLVASVPSSERKDLFLKNLVREFAKSDREAAAQWVPLIHGQDTIKEVQIMLNDL